MPLVAVTHQGTDNIPRAANHQGTFVASTMSLNLTPGCSLSDASGGQRGHSRLGVPTEQAFARDAECAKGLTRTQVIYEVLPPPALYGGSQGAASREYGCCKKFCPEVSAKGHRSRPGASRCRLAVLNPDNTKPNSQLIAGLAFAWRRVASLGGRPTPTGSSTFRKKPPNCQAWLAWSRFRATTPSRAPREAMPAWSAPPVTPEPSRKYMD